MIKAKGIFSLILSALLLTGTLILIGSCASGEPEAPASDGTSEFDGTWMKYNASVWVISDGSVEEYLYSKSEDAYLPSAEYFEKELGIRSEYRFAFEEGVLTQTMVNDGVAGGSFSMSVSVRGDRLTATVLDGPGAGTVMDYVRIDGPVTELKQLRLKAGVWYTEDRKYGLEVQSEDEESFIGFYNSGCFFEGSRANSEQSAEMIAIVALSKGYMVWANNEESSEGLNLPSSKRLTYTLDGDRLTIGGLEQITVAKQGADGSVTYELCPVSELIFVYEGNQ